MTRRDPDPARLRSIRIGDWRTLARLSIEAFPDATPAQVSRTLRDESNIIVLEVDGEPAGYAAFRHERDGLLWRDWMVVAGPLRGRGYGDRLVDAVEATAALRGYSRIMLAVLKTNAGAVRFHQSHGYEIVGEDQRKFHMSKELRGPHPGEVPRIPDRPRPRIVRALKRLLYPVIVHPGRQGAKA